MRVNVYAEEMTNQVKVFERCINGQTLTALRIYLHLPVTQPDSQQIRGPFMHRPDDDDSSAVTFWGKPDTLLETFEKVIECLRQRSPGN